MKSVILICALGMLLVCQESLSIDFPAELEGNCDPSEVGMDTLSLCVNVKCNKTEDENMSVRLLDCGLFRCRDGRENNGDPDLTKKFPECCPRLICDE